MTERPLLLGILLAALTAGGAVPSAATPQSDRKAIVGGTVIDGNGGAPIEDAIIVLTGRRITAVGPRSRLSTPPDAEVIDAKGRWVVPGFIDTNVHLSLYGGVGERYETLVRYESRQYAIVLEAAQLQLKHGVTTVRDSYGVLLPLMEVRDAVASGKAVGPRMLVAGNIVGWGGPYSVSFSLIQEKGLTLFQERMNDAISQGVGEELMAMSGEELRAAISAYLDTGPDFIKYGGTSHFARPTFIGFSPEAQRIIMEEAHRRGRVAETHATTAEGLRLSLDAGIDLIQHPEVLDDREIPDELVRRIREQNVICSMLSNTVTGEAWKKHLKDREAAEKKRAEEEQKGTRPARPRTGAEQRQWDAELGLGLEKRRLNAEKLIRAGCTVTAGTDNYWAAAPELTRTPKPETQDHGLGTILAIEGLVELGMTPAQAIVAATRNGALASRGLDDYGTLEPGKFADLLVLEANPLEDIANIRKIVTIMKEGRTVDRDRLPERRVLSRPPAAGQPVSETRGRS
jgi:imidazolonepropionase-like amidohydrolase